MNQITDQIWIGSSQDAKDADALRAAGITAILNCAEDLPPALGWRDGFTHFHCGLRDDSNHPLRYHAARRALDALVEEGFKVLVHCHEGRSRSVYIVAYHLSKETGDKLPLIEEFVKRVAEKRPQASVHPGHYKFMA